MGAETEDGVAKRFEQRSARGAGILGAGLVH